MTFRHATSVLLMVLSTALFWGCGGPKVDEKKPLAEIHTEAQKMSSREIGRVAKAYGKAIDLKRKAVDDLRDRLEDMEPEQLASNGAATLKKDADAVAASIASLRERQALYTELLHTKVDPEKPLSDIETETETMDAEKIRTIAEAYLQGIYNGRTDVENHQIRQRDQHKIIPKHHNVGANPTSRAQAEQSDQSNWASSPGGVSIGTDAPSAARKRGPRWSRTQRTTD